MKVALLLSGSIRNVEDTFESMKYHILDKYETDVFIYGVNNINDYESNINMLEGMFKPKKMVLNNPKFYDDINISLLKNSNTDLFYNNAIRALFNVKNVNILKNKYESDNNFKYDMVIRSRFDLFWIRSVSEHEIKKVYGNEIVIPYEWAFRKNHQSGGPNNFGYSDFYAISNSDNMDYYSSIFDKISDFPYNFHPESVIGYYLQDKKVFESSRHVTIDYPTKFNPFGDGQYASKYLEKSERDRLEIYDYDFFSPRVWESPGNRKKNDNF
jgi:hypothetical protein